ncbi:MAG: amino acid ABC transporter substrate-binding protein, partial [Microbacterium sp.]
MNTKLVRRLALAMVAPLMMFAVACGSDDDGVKKAEGVVDGGPVTIVGQDFPEADVLVYLYKGLLDNAGFQASVKNLGGRDLYLEPLTKGTDFQISTDYLSSMTEALNRAANGDDAPVVASNDPVATLAELNKLAAASGLTALKPSEAQDANGFAVKKDFAEANNITTLSQLGALGQDLKLAAAPDCKKRPDCGVGLTGTYGLKIT